mgnify:CR=1 FL=1
MLNKEIKYNPESYFYYSDLQRVFSERALSKFSFVGNESILDVGSGDGKVTVSLSFRVPEGKVLGVDTSWPMLSFAKTKYPEKIYPNLSFIHSKNSDLSDLELSSKFDIFVSFNVLHLVSDIKAILSRLYTVLKPGGKFLVTLPSIMDTIHLNTFVKLSFKYKLPVFDYKVLESNNIIDIRQQDGAEALFKDAGFKDLSVNLIKTRYVFIDVKEFMNWSKGTSPYDLGLKKENEFTFYLDFIREYIVLDPDAAGLNNEFIPISNHILIKGTK